MALIDIRARFTCDGCGRPFSVQIESPYEPPEGWSMFDVAEDALRGSVRYEGPNAPEGFAGSSSVDGERHLCGRCTPEADAARYETEAT